MAIQDLKEQIARLPEQPGVYLYGNRDGQTIYVGKARALRDRGEPNIVALQPLVVQDSVIMRAADSSKLIGVDLRTGKRQWVFPPFDDSPALLAATIASPDGRPAGTLITAAGRSRAER